MNVLISFETSDSVYLVTQLLIEEELNSRLHRYVNLRTRTVYQLYVKNRYDTHKFGISCPVNGGGYRRLHCAFRLTIFRIRFIGIFFFLLNCTTRSAVGSVVSENPEKKGPVSK